MQEIDQISKYFEYNESQVSHFCGREARINHVVFDYLTITREIGVRLRFLMHVDRHRMCVRVHLFMPMCVYKCKYISSFFPLRGTGSSDTQILLSKYHSPLGGNRTMWGYG